MHPISYRTSFSSPPFSSPFCALISYIARHNLSSLRLTGTSYEPPTELSMMVLHALSASKARAPMLNSRAHQNVHSSYGIAV